MAIRFRCAHCQQPLEVDDGMAGEAVTCYYCRKVVTTPAQSDPNVSTAAPEARTGGDTTATPAPPPNFAPPATTSSQSNPMGWIALVLMGICMVSAIYTVGVFDDIAHENPDITTQQEFNTALQKGIEARPGAYAVMMLGGCATTLVAMILGIIALALGRRPRWPAIVALAMVLVNPIIFCSGLTIALSDIATKLQP